MVKNFIRSLSIIILFSVTNLCWAIPALSEDELQQTKSQARLSEYDGIPVLVLSGSSYSMGVQYGSLLKNQMNQVLNGLESYYITDHGLTYAELLKQASLLYNRFPSSSQLFIQGMARGSGLSLSDAKILNAMETLGELLHADPVKCAFLLIPQTQTTTGASLIGRNYDYPAPFDQLSKYLTITILKEDNKVPTAFISIAGEAYCPSCINANGIFMELNNGGPSGGAEVNESAPSMLSTMLTTLQQANNMADVEAQLKTSQSDYSLIVNSANANQVLSFEFSTNPSLGSNYFYPDVTQAFASTNFFLDPVWGDRIPTPTDATTWMGVTRRNNLLNLAAQSNQFDIRGFERLMETRMDQGGALWDLTVYQLIFDASSLSLYVRVINNLPAVWTYIPLKTLFNS